ncbi:chemotaxis protein CheW [Jeotgalibaca caeni]|uniref:chemotaxis protein CheW n=1 Tax=Jeotgalibaca caeni TaxID=3028623 RepID=UPI00237DC1A3|nr:chemotaxis protein CheW [Jeotgalibaca caeni]MDE1548300.1 chemotaxis protein CheW [Jeotgalibaca caeni]
MQIVIFSLMDKLYAIPSDDVEEITGKVAWTDVPKTPNWLLGLVNLRGTVISLIHFEQFLNFTRTSQETENLCYNNTVIVKNGKTKTAFAVDRVEEVIHLDEEELQLIGNQDTVQGVFSRKDQIVNLIHLPTLFSKNEGSI